MKKNIIKNILGVSCLLALPLTTMAANPYDFSRWEKNINEANWQVGHNSFTVCKANQGNCEAALDENQWKVFAYANRDNYFRYSTDGNQTEGWRNEFRFADSFSRGSSRDMSTKIRVWTGSTTSKGFTVAQLHMEDGDGPPVRVEVVDEDHFQVKWRHGPDCDKNERDCFDEDNFGASLGGFRKIELDLLNNFINVSVEGETYSYDLRTWWPSDGQYYWKSGIYLQEDGAVETAARYLYW